MIFKFPLTKADFCVRMVLSLTDGGGAVVRPTSYSTKQGKAILSYISALGDKQITVEQIAAHFDENGTPIGITTIYRHLDKLEHSGQVRKLVIDGVPGACYQCVGTCRSDSFHLKCDSCGKLVNIDCGTADEFGKHILNSHEFRIDPIKTVFYGRCKACQSID